MNSDTLNEQCQQLYRNILTAVENNDKLRSVSDDFSAILKRSISDFKKSLLETVQPAANESDCGEIGINSLNAIHSDEALITQTHQITDMENLVFVKHEVSNVEQQNDFIKMVDNSTNLDQWPTFEMDIQEEVVVTTTNIDDNLITNKADFVKRKAKLKNATQSHKKRRRTMDESDLRTANDSSLFKQPVAKFRRNRHSNLRKTIASRTDLKDEIIGKVSSEERFISAPKNICIEMYGKNDLYRTLCMLCNRNERYLVAHYVRQHQKNEVLIARPSPQMANKIRSHTELFEMQNRKIKGMCYFCEEKKTMSKYNWAAHILSHTGESIYFCSICDVSMKNKRDHKACNNEPINIYDANASDASLNAFMCIACNYLQISRERIVRHLIQEHGHHEVEEMIHFENVVLVPDLTLPLDSNVPMDYGFSVRFKCTICAEHSKNVGDFIAHFDETHPQVDEYDCLCGEKIQIFHRLNHTENDISCLDGSIIATHLATHNADLYRCMICNDLFLTHHNVQDHLLNEHSEQPFRYQHIHRGTNDKVSIDESTILSIKCHICGETLQYFAQAIKHFNRNHNEDEIQIEGLISRKIAQQQKMEMKYFAYMITF